MQSRIDEITIACVDERQSWIQSSPAWVCSSWLHSCMRREQQKWEKCCSSVARNTWENSACVEQYDLCTQIVGFGPGKRFGLGTYMCECHKNTSTYFGSRKSAVAFRTNTRTAPRSWLAVYIRQLPKPASTSLLCVWARAWSTRSSS